MDNSHPIENLMRCTMENLIHMIDVNTVIGDTVQTNDGSYIIPISKVSFGFASGGSEFGTEKSNKATNSDFPFGGGSGAGVSVKPVAFLVLRENSIRLLPVDVNNTYDRIVDTIPQIIEIIKESMNKQQKNNCYSSETPKNE